MPAMVKRQRSPDSPLMRGSIRRFLLADDHATPKKPMSKGTSSTSEPNQEVGSGTPADPYHLPLRASANRSGCWHCTTDACSCLFFEQALQEAYADSSIKRVTEVAGARHLCAKSLLPQFVSRMIKLMNITEDDTFYDLGCGNGSILFQVACLTGAKCVGIEISSHNCKVARSTWDILKPRLETKFGKKMPEITFIEADLTQVLRDPAYFANSKGKAAILLSNLLFPKSLTHYISERLRSVPAGTRILCFDDLYPHGRALAAIRDPEAFAFFNMIDYKWQELSVEWCSMEGSFFIHERKPT